MKHIINILCQNRHNIYYYLGMNLTVFVLLVMASREPFVTDMDFIIMMNNVTNI